MSIEVRGTSVSPLRTCINSVVEHVSCIENYYCFVIELSCSALSLSLSRTGKLSIKPACFLCSFSIASARYLFLQISIMFYNVLDLEYSKKF